MAGRRRGPQDRARRYAGKLVLVTILGGQLVALGAAQGTERSRTENAPVGETTVTLCQPKQRISTALSRGSTSNLTVVPSSCTKLYDREGLRRGVFRHSQPVRVEVVSISLLEYHPGFSVALNLKRDGNQ